MENSKKDTGNRFEVSSVVYDNSAFVTDDIDNLVRQPAEQRRPSVSDFFSNFVPGSKKVPNSKTGDEVSSRKNSRANSIFTEFFKDSDNHVMDYNNETAPRLESYRNSLTMNKYLIRPSLDELHDSQQQGQPSLTPGKGQNTGAVKFGWIKGVYIRCLLNIWGVMLFLRMGWMTGQCGIGLAIVIIMLSTVVTVITTLSMSAICTNGDVRGGGAYYLISRSLGPEFGGVVGILLFLANAISGAMYIIGAGEAIRDILREFGKGIVEHPSGTNDIRLTGILCLLLMMSITGIGMEFENKTQMILLTVLLVAMSNYFVGACLPPTDQQRAHGFIGWNASLAATNFVPDFRGETFFSVFAVFFPSVTGILAGANISGDLKDPCTAIPKGTFLSILTTSISYIMCVIWLGFTVVRDASGQIINNANVINGTFNDSGALNDSDSFNDSGIFSMDGIFNDSGTVVDCSVSPCKYGLMNDYQVMTMSAGLGPLIYAGIFAATLSSALVSIVSAPRILQALCVDRIIPWLNFFGKGYGKDNDPRRGLALTFIIAVLFTIIGDLNAVAPIISNFFMAANGLINFACFHASYVKTPGFRPGFRYYNLWLSLVGALICVVIMFVMNWITALITDLLVIALYVYIAKTCPDINWGSSFQGYAYRNALYHLNKLSKVEDHVKNYRPSVLVLSGHVSSRPQLVDLAGHMTKNHALQICADISKEPKTWNSRRLLNDLNMKWLIERKVKAFYCLVEEKSMVEAVCGLVQTTGIGKMKPNILLMGFKENWSDCDSADMIDYFQVIHESLDAHISIAVLRMPGGTNYAKFFETEEGLPVVVGHEKKEKNKKLKIPEIKIVLETVPEESSSPRSSSPDVSASPPPYDSYHHEPSLHNIETIPTYNLNEILESETAVVRDCESLPPNLEKMANIFHVKQEPGTIDIWWLYDDGGLTVLLPYIFTTRNRFKDCKLRVFSVAQDESDISDEQLNLALLLRKFRIPFTDLTILSSVAEPLNKESAKRFEDIISKWITSDETQKDPATITRSALNTHKKKTNQFLRLRELLEKHSKDSNMVVMTMPLPRKNGCPAPLYMAWLDILTKDLPPFLLVRGNQTSVLTFYS